MKRVRMTANAEHRHGPKRTQGNCCGIMRQARSGRGLVVVADLFDLEFAVFTATFPGVFLFTTAIFIRFERETGRFTHHAKIDRNREAR